MPFQNTVTLQPAPAQAGDFASANPRSSVLAGPSALVAGASGLTAGLFAWIDSTQTYAANTGSGVPDGFVHRGSNIGRMTAYLAETGSLVPSGYEVTLHDSGDFWAVTLTTATRGQKVFAVNADGTVKTGATGATITGATETAWFVQSNGAVGELIMISHRKVGVA